MLRVAIVGVGPKGLFALERLLDHAARADGARIEVDLFEPHPAAGAGPNYDPRQPPYLRMNFPAGAVDMWWPSSAVVPRGERRSFAAWSGGCDAAAYPARAEVGRYLADGLASLLRHAPSGVRVTLRRARADAVRSNCGQWDVVVAGVARSYDEVLLATGHEQSPRGGLARVRAHPATLVQSVFPVGRWLCSQRVRPGATVAVRGFALTFIDAALALTEGRGGSFEALDHPYRLRYVPGDEDAGVILPFSRSGRAMLAKPGPAFAAAHARALAAIAEQGCSRILGLAGAIDVHGDLLPILAATAADGLHACRDASGHAADQAMAPDRWLAAAAAGRLPASEHDPAEELERSLAIGAGLRAPDAQWALGHAWRSLYPALVSRLGGDGLAERQWPVFRALAAELERVAFGPAPLNVAKLLALVDAGRIDLRHVRGAAIRSHGGRTLLCSEHGERPVDVVVDAVLPGPGAAGERSEPLRGLLDRGHVRVAPGRRGLDVDAAGGCRGRDAVLRRGLSAIGRVTEDVVIGNDTLNRTLHPLADQWARRLVERCREDLEVAAAPAPRATIG